MRDSGPIVHKPQWSILHALMPSFPQSYYWINAKQCMDLFIRNRPFLPIFWKRRKKAEHLLSKCSFPVYCALLPILYNLSCARILIAARGLITIGPPYVLLCLPAWQQIRRALLFQTFFCKVWHLNKALIISTGHKSTDEAHYKNWFPLWNPDLEWSMAFEYIMPTNKDVVVLD